MDTLDPLLRSFRGDLATEAHMSRGANEVPLRVWAFIASAQPLLDEG